MNGLNARLPLEELMELGVHHVAVNMAFDGLFSLSAKSRWEKFVHGDRSWFVNPALVASWDKQISFATQHGIVVTGTVLVRKAPTVFGQLVTPPPSRIPQVITRCRILLQRKELPPTKRR